jgi:hypothetical protein
LRSTRVFGQTPRIPFASTCRLGSSMTNDANETATGRSRYRRLSRGLLISMGILLFFWGAAALNDRIRPVKRFGQLTTWYTADQAEQHFNMAYPTEKDIASYLSNATILISDMSFGQAVYYFDAPNRFIQWRNDGSSRTDLVSGLWFTKWYLLPMELNGRWRIALVYSFCKWLPDGGVDPPQDSCKIVENLNLLFAGGDATREYRAGNVFDLSAGGFAPFPLPTATRISIDGLLAIKKAKTEK